MTDGNVALHRLVRRRETGIVLVLLGVVLAIAGLVRTTTSKPDTDDCPAGTTLVAKFNFVGGVYVFEKPAGNATVVTITGGTATGGSWSSTQAISGVVVKGGPNAVVTSYSPAAMSGTFSNAGLPDVGNGRTPDISHLEFCGGGSSSTTTSTSVSTSTSTSTTTSTSIPEITTTTAVPATTTTTRPDTTTTTVGTAGTTVPEQTTTTTTSLPGTTTTVAAATTTTLSDGTTSTTVGTAGTTVPEQTTTTTTSDVGQAASSVTSTTVVPNRADPEDTLPRTGAPSVPLITIGLLLASVGAALTIVNLRRDRAGTRRSS